MHEAVAELKKRIDIIEFIGSFITLKKAGRNFKALCPFHNEKSPSFIVSPDRQLWHCFGGCHEGGDVIKFLMKWENITFYEAIKELADRYDVKLAFRDFDDKGARVRERLFALNHLASEYFAFVLHKSPYGKEARDYLLGRGLNEKIIQTFGLGYAPASWDSMSKFLTKKKYSLEEMVAAGLVVKNERGRVYDRFRGRIMFPLKDIRGMVVGFSGRLLKGEGSGAKYINTPETVLYHKREMLYGVDAAREAIKKEGNVYLVEGEFDMISPYAHGIVNTVAVKGSAVTKEQLMLLRRYTGKLTFALDADEAGIEAVVKGIELAEEMELELHVAVFDFAKDPDEAVRTDVVRFKKALDEALPVYDFLLEVYRKKFPDKDPFSHKKRADGLVPLFDRIRNPIVRTFYFRKLAAELDVDVASLELIARRLNLKKVKYVRPVTAREDKDSDRAALIEKYALSLVLQSTDSYKAVDEFFAVSDASYFSVPAHQKIIKAYQAFRQSHPRYEINAFVATLPAELQAVADELYLFASGDISLAELSLSRLAYEVKRYGLKRLIARYNGAEEVSEETKKALQEATAELNRVEKTIVSL